MRRDDPKRLAAEEKRDHARAWLEILCKGIGHALAEGESRYYPETVWALIERVNGELSEAVRAAEAAEKAYEPYWRRRRGSIRRVRSPKKTTKAA